MITQYLYRIVDVTRALIRLHETLDEIKFNQGCQLARRNGESPDSPQSLVDVEFKIFSQWGEDGIIQYLTSCLTIENKTFVEFGVGDFSESNCRFLMEKDDWRGFVVEADDRCVSRMKRRNFYWRHDLVAENELLTRENVNTVLARSGFDRDLGILSIDVDGNDYYLLEAIDIFSPRILICEFNPVFDPTRQWVVPYDAEFQRSRAHYSHLYWGASLGAIVALAEKKGFRWVGVGSQGANAFFVRMDLVEPDLPTPPPVASVDAHFRESRDRNGHLTFLRGSARRQALQGLPVIDLESNSIITL